MLDEAVPAFERANKEYADARHKAEELDFGRPAEKHAAITRLQVPSGDEKPMAYTAAERLVETEPQYADYCKALRLARWNEQLAWGKMVVAQNVLKAMTREVG